MLCGCRTPISSAECSCAGVDKLVTERVHWRGSACLGAGLPQDPSLQFCFPMLTINTTSATKPWFRSRGYRHFDNPVSEAWALAYVANAQNIEQHRFWPFIAYSKSAPRYNSSAHKTEEKIRPIAYASHADSQVFAYYSQLIGREYERYVASAGLSESVIGYRALGKSNVDLAAEAFDQIERFGPCMALGFDVSRFFDNIRHEVLKRNWAKTLGEQWLPKDHYAVFRALTRFAVVDRNAMLGALGMSEQDYARGRSRVCSTENFRTSIAPLIRRNDADFGIPQGSPLSALASNLSMIEFDTYVANKVSETGGIYRRYSDDVLIVCGADQASSIEAEVKGALKYIGLELKDSKTVRCRFTAAGNQVQTADGSSLPYLGFTFNGRHRLVRSSSLSRHWRRLHSKVHAVERNAIHADEGITELFRKDIYERFTHLGATPNFIHYVYRASRTMHSKAIRRQVRRHMGIVDRAIRKAEESLK